MNRSILTFVLVVLLSAAALSACGRSGAPDHPPGTTYPRTYPDQ